MLHEIKEAILENNIAKTVDLAMRNHLQTPTLMLAGSQDSSDEFMEELLGELYPVNYKYILLNSNRISLIELVLKIYVPNFTITDLSVIGRKNSKIFKLMLPYVATRDLGRLYITLGLSNKIENAKILLDDVRFNPYQNPLPGMDYIPFPELFEAERSKYSSYEERARKLPYDNILDDLEIEMGMLNAVRSLISEIDSEGSTALNITFEDLNSLYSKTKKMRDK